MHQSQVGSRRRLETVSDWTRWALERITDPRSGETGVFGAVFVRVLRLGLLTGAMVLISATIADPDLWGHVTFGRDIVVDGAVHLADPYSFTSDRPWINHEWLAEVVMYLAYAAGGPVGIVALKTSVVLVAFAFVLYAVQRSGLRPIDQDLLAGAILIGMFYRYYAVRPQIFSLLLFAALLHVLTIADRGGRRWLGMVPVITAAWANLHGGYIVGLGVLGIWLLVRFVQETNVRRRLSLVAVGASGIAATLINPYGYGLWVFLWSTVGLSRPDISDWQPILSLSPIVYGPFVLVACIAIAGLLRARARVDPAYFLIVLVLGLMPLRISRIDGFFAIAVGMLLAPYFGRIKGSPRPAQNLPSGRLRVIGGVAAASIVLGGLAFAARGARCVDVRLAPEAEVVEFFKVNRLTGRALTFFTWGEYAIWYLAPDVKVSMDGRRETVYSQAVIDDHMRLYRGEPGATSLVTRIDPDFIWLPVDSPAIETLRREGWEPIYSGKISTILAMDSGRSYLLPEAVVGTQCFPSTHTATTGSTPATPGGLE